MVGLYVHIPFCKRKCDYCHFYVTRPGASREALLLEGLQKEWETSQPLLQGRTLKTVYFGGGTPSQAKPETLEAILDLLPLASCEEITLEANPDDITPDYAKALQRLGINRVSLGVQTLSDPLLSQIGRTHSSQKALDALRILADAGLSNLSIDLMLDLPNQTLTQVEETLQQIEALPITHVSLYNLVIEPPSAFYNKRKAIAKQMPADDASLAMLNLTCQTLASLGFLRYEISAFAKPSYEACHNTSYWTGVPFLGLGPSAFSYWEGRRFRNVANLEEYAKRLKLGQSPVDFEETLSDEGRWRELLVVALRLIKGVDLESFSGQHGPPPDLNLEPLLQDKLLTQKGSHLSLTDKGRLFYDTVASHLVM